MAEVFNGFFKLQEEMGELNQVLGKLGAFPNGKHPDDKGHLNDRLHEEIGDVYAALDYFVYMNGLDKMRILERKSEKLELFHEWNMAGIKL